MQQKKSGIKPGDVKIDVGQDDAEWNWYVKFEERTGTTTAYRTASWVNEDSGHRKLLFDYQCAGSMPCHRIYLPCPCHTDMTHTPVLHVPIE